MTGGIAAAVICGIAILILLGFLFVYFNNDLLTVKRYRAELNMEKPVKVLHLSDLHAKSFGPDNARLLQKVRAEKPDFIAFTGDIVHNYSPKNKRVALRFMSDLTKIAPVLYVSGNHEMRNKGYRFFRKDLMEAGAIVLDDEEIEICGVKVVGLNCASLKNGTIDRFKEGAENKILLAHMPQFFETYRDAGFKLVLSGHAHGGQWNIPFTRIGVYAPGQGMFPKYCSGQYEKGGMKMIVSRGLGNSEFPLRLFNPPEICVIEVGGR